MLHDPRPESTSPPKRSKTKNEGKVLPFPNKRSAGSPNVVAPSDHELLERCRSHDAEAWDLLVGRYERLIFSVAMKNGLAANDAADITQTTFVALIDSLDRIDDDTKLASWLMTVARRQAWRLRSHSRATIVTDKVPDSPVDPFQNWGDQSAIHDALSTLGGTCRELLLALFFDPTEPSYAEVAEHFGRSIGGIGPMRGRCLERLRRIILEEGGMP